MWEAVILHDFMQRERKQQFNNQVKEQQQDDYNQSRGTPNSKQGTDSGTGEQNGDL